MPTQHPFRIVVLGNFSGGRDTESEPAYPTEIDRDDFDSVLARMQPRLHLDVGAGVPPVSIGFSEFDDFEPDAIYARLELFRELRDLRARLLSPVTFAETARELGGWSTKQQTEPDVDEDPGGGSAPGDGSEGLLAATIGATEGTFAAEAGTGSRLVDDLVRTIVAPYVLPRPDPRQAELVASVDAAATRLMRSILHHSDFQALEALWRAVFLLVRRLDTGAGLQIHLLDVSRGAIDADLQASTSIDASTLGRALVEPAVGPGGVPWGLWIGAFQFEPTATDCKLLGHLGAAAARTGAPFLASAHPRFVGHESLAAASDPETWSDALAGDGGAAWRALRASPAALHLGLTFPRFLVRLPYGPGTHPIESFPFEELAGPPAHDELLWGDSSFLAALLLGEASLESGRGTRAAPPRDVDGLPLYVQQEGERDPIRPCTEIRLVERGAERLAAMGLTPVWSVKGTDSVRLGAIRAISDPPRPIEDVWR